MTGAVSRKIAIAQQLEEAIATAAEPAAGATRHLADERQRRRKAIVATLEFCRDHEHEIRAWAEARKAEGSK